MNIRSVDANALPFRLLTNDQLKFSLFNQPEYKVTFSLLSTGLNKLI